MSDQNLIAIECKSKSGQRVVFKVLEIISIDGRPLRPDQNDVTANILQRLAAIEALIPREGDHAAE